MSTIVYRYNGKVPKFDGTSNSGRIPDVACHGVANYGNAIFGAYSVGVIDMTNNSTGLRTYAFIVPASDLQNDYPTNVGEIEIGIKRNITQLTLDFGIPGSTFGLTCSQTGGAVRLYIKNTTDVTISGAGSLDTTGATLVYISGTIFVLGNQTWFSFNNGNFVWDGTSNVKFYIEATPQVLVPSSFGLNKIIGGTKGSSNPWAVCEGSGPFPMTGAPVLSGSDHILFDAWTPMPAFYQGIRFEC